MKRYFIHRYRDVTWTLVFDDVSGRWHVEKTGPNKACLRFSLIQFESSDNGKQLGDRLAMAVKQAELDA